MAPQPKPHMDAYERPGRCVLPDGSFVSQRAYCDLYVFIRWY